MTPPSSTTAELSVLGGIFVRPERLDDVMDVVKPTDFYDGRHGVIYAAMCAVSAESKPVDQITVSEHLRASGALPDAGGLAYVNEVFDGTATAAGIVDHARLVADLSRVRAVIRAAQDIISRGMRDHGDAGQFCDDAEALVMAAAQRGSTADVVAMRDVVRETFTWLDELQRTNGTAFGIPTGIRQLDDWTTGLQPGSITVIGAQTSIGKTALAMQVARSAGVPVVLFSMEQPRKQIAMRGLAGESGVPLYRIIAPRYWGRDGASRLTDAASELAKSQIYIDDRTALTPLQVRSRLRRLKRRHEIGLFIVDYLQIGQPSKPCHSREREVASMAEEHHDTAMELDIPGILLSQMRRLADGERPSKRALRDSGAIEQSADCIVLAHRPEFGKHAPGEAEPAELILDKNRLGGPVGTIKCTFDPDRIRFVDDNAPDAPPVVRHDAMAGLIDSQEDDDAPF